MDFFQSASGGVVLTLAGVAVYGALVAWARRPGHADRWPVLVAATSTGLVVAGANTFAGRDRLVGRTLVLRLADPLAGELLGAVARALHHPPAGRLPVAPRPRPAAAPGLRPARAGRARPFTVCIDTWALGAGYLSMGAGYEIWHDVLVGQAFFWLPVLIYEVARLLWQAPAGEPVAGTGRG